MLCRWLLEPEFQGAVRHVSSVRDAMHNLQAIPMSERKHLQENGAAASSYFRYRHMNAAESPLDYGTATDVIIQHICQRARNSIDLSSSSQTLLQRPSHTKATLSGASTSDLAGPGTRGPIR